VPWTVSTALGKIGEDHPCFALIPGRPALGLDNTILVLYARRVAPVFMVAGTTRAMRPGLCPLRSGTARTLLNFDS
jgi:hypothetical protein